MKASFFEKALDASFDGVLIADCEGVVIYVNPQYEAITGLARADVLGRSLYELRAEGIINRAISLEVLETGQPVSAMHQYVGGKSALSTARPVFDEHGHMEAVFNNTRNLDDLIAVRAELDVAKARQQRSDEEISHLRSLQQTGQVVFTSRAMSDVLALADRVAEYDATVTIYGESGTGKEVLSRYIYNASPRREGPFIKVNCAAIPPDLFESELFGYERGAFTGASEKGRAGLFELANGGTLFLDEIGELRQDMQSKLLRAIQEKEITRVGGKAPIHLDVRLIAATNRSLEDEVAKGRFREDLFFRLNVFPLHIPPLRERPEDIPLLVHAFMDRLNRKYASTKTVSPEAMSVFRNYAFPGNVRELENLVEYLFILCANTIGQEVIPPKILAGAMLNKTDAVENREHLPQLVELFERTIIEDAIRQYRTLESAAEVLGIHYSTLSRKMRKFGLKF